MSVQLFPINAAEQENHILSLFKHVHVKNLSKVILI